MSDLHKMGRALDDARDAFGPLDIYQHGTRLLSDDELAEVWGRAPIYPPPARATASLVPALVFGAAMLALGLLLGAFATKAFGNSNAAVLQAMERAGE